MLPKGNALRCKKTTRRQNGMLRFHRGVVRNGLKAGDWAVRYCVQESRRLGDCQAAANRGRRRCAAPLDARLGSLTWLAAICTLCSLTAAGCSTWQVPTCDATGQHVFLEPAVGPLYRIEPSPYKANQRTALTISPRNLVAPVGSEVVVLAGVRGCANFLVTNERIEWSIAPGGVGELVAVSSNWGTDWLFGEFGLGKVNATYAIGTTSREFVRLSRGTPTPGDDVLVKSGQAWATVTSNVEGASYVTAYAPSVYSWDCHRQTAEIHWVDAQWQFPSPAINPAGTRRVLTTTVTRHSDHAPCTGWHVRYQIIDGPAAAFGSPDGAPAADVEVDIHGLANVEIFQKSPASGSNRVSIEILRPAAPGSPAGMLLSVARGGTVQTWTAPQIAVHATGPATAAVGANVTYRIAVSNPGDLPADDVVVSDDLPEGVAYISSNPPGEFSERHLQWRLGRLAGRQTQTLEMCVRVDRPGNVQVSVDAVAAGGLKARDCAATTVSASPASPTVPAAPTTPAAPPRTSIPTSSQPQVEVKISGSDQAKFDEWVKWQVVVTNRGAAATPALQIKFSFDSSVELRDPTGQLRRGREVGGPLPTLAAGESQPVNIELHMTEAGRWCGTAEVYNDSGTLARDKKCLTVSAAASTPPVPVGPTAPGGPAFPRPGSAVPPVAPPGAPLFGPPPTAVPPAQVTVKASGPVSASVGDKVKFEATITNTGTRDLSGLKIAFRPDPAVEPSGGSSGSKSEAGEMVWTQDSVKPGVPLIFQVEAKCGRVANQACNHWNVTSAEGAGNRDETCFAIREAAAPPVLKATASGLLNPVNKGGELTYAIEVVNTGVQPARDVTVTATVPAGMTPVPLGTHSELTATLPLDGQTVRFAPLPELRPNQTAKYWVHVQAKQEGEMRLRVNVESPSIPTPVATEAITHVQSSDPLFPSGR